MADRTARDRTRLAAAEMRVWDHYGVGANSNPLVLDDPPLTIRVVRCGEGPPTVLLHGGSMTATVWAPLLPHLPGRSVLMVDLPGCGLADPFDYTAVDIAAHQHAFVASVLNPLGLKRAALIGTSLGGMFALRFTLPERTRVTAVALVSAPAVALPGARVPLPMSLFSNRRLGQLLHALTPPPSPRAMRQLLGAIGGKKSVRDLPESLLDALGAAMALAGATNVSMAPEMARRSIPHAHIPMTDEELADCKVPVQLISGSEDKVQAPDAGIRAAALMPDARIDVLTGGHGIWLEDPARYGDLLAEFLHHADEQTPFRGPLKNVWVADVVTSRAAAAT